LVWATRVALRLERPDSAMVLERRLQPRETRRQRE
jgi:hypothetical protein